MSHVGILQVVELSVPQVSSPSGVDIVVHPPDRFEWNFYQTSSILVFNNLSFQFFNLSTPGTFDIPSISAARSRIRASVFSSSGIDGLKIHVRCIIFFHIVMGGLGLAKE